ncbi:hypothetical protein [Bordetella genomosp. 5]|uniref:Uncharacterized protein n=1 Tax=Bordetella genomosp. 5 TaxID=1395608 RepID=A0A261T3W6_9BORD|nr:hypothetical protein [Bordetella genomosp. 5]OZI43810.1 hypothetical protein CAL25_23045 [Bordetella genomosp. 5]
MSTHSITADALDLPSHPWLARAVRYLETTGPLVIAAMLLLGLMYTPLPTPSSDTPQPAVAKRAPAIEAALAPELMMVVSLRAQP